MAGIPPGPTGSGKPQGSVKDQTTALMATPPPLTTGVTYTKGITPGQERFHHKGTGISFELSDAPAMCVPTTLRTISEDEMQILAWILQYKGEIIAAEAEFQVDRRAIAGAIAWEAIHNVLKSSLRAVGAGKPHLWDWKLRLDFLTPILVGVDISDEDMWVKEVENAKILPPRSSAERRELLRKPEEAIRYVGATMSLIARIYEDNGSPGVCSPPIRLNPPILTNEYQGSTAKKWKARVKTIKPGEVLKPGNKMALWIADPRNVQYLEDAVGSPQVDKSAAQTAGSCDGDYRDATPQESARILEEAQKYEGTPYSYGGDSKTGIDCSHLVWRAINKGLPEAKFQYAVVADTPKSPSLRELKSGEAPVAGDVLVFSHHSGFYDPSPPADKMGCTLYSARGDQDNSGPGVTWGKSAWFPPGTPRYFRVRVPCK